LQLKKGKFSSILDNSVPSNLKDTLQYGVSFASQLPGFLLPPSVSFPHSKALKLLSQGRLEGMENP
jgi:hypothetical protein